MNEIPLQKLFELYNDTLSKCGIHLLTEDDETIEYDVYEEFDLGVHSFLHIDSLRRLYDSNLISLEQLQKSVLLRKKFIRLQNSNEWGIECFRTSNKWKEIMKLSDEIRAIN